MMRGMNMKFRLVLLVMAITLFTACTFSDSLAEVTTPTPIKQTAKKTDPVLKTNSSYENVANSINLTKATVTKVVDGDTIHVEIKGKSYKIRLVGINCPEYTKEIQFYGKESTDYTKNQLLGKTVYLETDVSDTDQYDRLLRYIWLETPNDINEQEIRTKLFNAILVINGFARAGYYPPDLKYTDYLKDYQQKAKDSKIGMWSK